MRIKMLGGSCPAGAVAILALCGISSAQMTKYDEDQRLNMDSRVDGMTGRAASAEADYRRYCYGDLVDGVAGNNNHMGAQLPGGSRAPTWNGVPFEFHYVYRHQLTFIGRFEKMSVSRQANGSGSANPSASNFGNITTYTLGYRDNSFMTSRAGFAWYNEYNWRQDGTGPSLGLTGSSVNTGELLLGFDSISREG